MAAKKSTDERAKERAKKHSESAKRYQQGFTEGRHDIAHGKTLRAHGAKSDPYAKGYRAGVRVEREYRKIAGK